MKRLPEYLLILYSLTATISIAVSQIVMTMGALVGIVDRGRRTVFQWRKTGLEWPLLAWAGACLVASAFAADPWESLEKSKKVLLLGMIYWAPAVLTRSWSFGRLYMGLLFSAGVTSLYGVTTFFLYGGPIHGFHGFYLTNSGLLLLCTCPALLFAFSSRIAPSHRIGAAITAVSILAVQFFGRLPAAWIGTAAAIAYLGLRRRLPLVTALVPAAIVALLVVPGIFQDTMRQLIDPGSTSNQERFVIWANGWELFRAHPWTGLGLQDLGDEYARVAGPDQPVWGHMQSVPVHLAVSMGILGLATFAWLVVGMFRALSRARRDSGGDSLLRIVVDGTEAGLVAFLAAGLIDWNYGDSEQLALLAFMIGTAIAAGRVGRESTAVPE